MQKTHGTQVVGLFLFLLLAGAATAGCKTVYIPNAVNVPLLAQKGEVRANLNTNNAQVAYAATDHVGVMANGQYESGPDGSGYLAEAGGGYFLSLANLPASVLEIYGGAGLGHVRHESVQTMNDVSTLRTFETNGLKLFLQPSAGFTLPYLDVALTGRLVGLQTYGVKTENYSTAQLMADHLDEVDGRFFLFWEPTITVRGGWKWVKAFAQYGYSVKLTDAALNRRDQFFYVGLHGTLADRFRARK